MVWMSVDHSTLYLNSGNYHHFQLYYDVNEMLKLKKKMFWYSFIISSLCVVKIGFVSVSKEVKILLKILNADKREIRNMYTLLIYEYMFLLIDHLVCIWVSCFARCLIMMKLIQINLNHYWCIYGYVDHLGQIVP